MNEKNVLEAAHYLAKNTSELGNRAYTFPFYARVNLWSVITSCENGKIDVDPLQIFAADVIRIMTDFDLQILFNANGKDKNTWSSFSEEVETICDLFTSCLGHNRLLSKIKYTDIIVQNLVTFLMHIANHPNGS